MFNNNTNKSTPLKRKKLTLKLNELKDEEFMSPVKRRAKMSTNTCDEFFRPSGPTTSSSSTNKFLFQRPPLDESLISPLKQQWKGFLSSPSNVNKNGLKTPSPARMMKQAVICKNIGNLLLMTPEKDSDEEEEDEEFDEGINEEEIENDEEEELKEEENNTKTTSIKKYPTKKRTTTSKKQNGGNFVKLNMRHRKFAPSSKFRIKKKWKRKFKN
uniref:Uncharacterized protein n=1 Tax=Meloidogyne incognita TaxID=6306 RepID=A0A914LIL1_MELIC